ncbi:STAS/SEC14 domain-containing protein [Marinobacterium aestuariivivens]|uniref:STAS/SEC14 domain-containing protein n=1 Tax=Marinobacterium aestuariivivens TaxID=1698799 RepID=A0ABW1ZUM1_9GAMM
MGTDRHGLTLEINQVNDEFMLSFKALGKLTHDDYAAITPVLESKLGSVKQPKIRAFVDAEEFRGWEPHAAWDDLKIGLHHGREFTRIAIYGHRDWMDWAARIGSWFIAGEVKHFDDRDAALDWLRRPESANSGR